mmetsp:Transcript_111602/g.320610  ORF Transcript_111602/g.320610 Transcript_111602/m.320610 type:complete len:291 (+) Transcript_111602:194-1066(+)
MAATMETEGSLAAHGGFCEGVATAAVGRGLIDSLNGDPCNALAEELAVTDCMHGLEIRRVWSEKELVFSFGGALVPGTPDGMFEDWDGALTCVQVVRVPLLADFDADKVREAIVQTVLTKVVKSQRWLRATHVSPHDFVIYCWLPFEIAKEVTEHAEALMERVRHLDHRFSLRLRVPALPGSLFPARFAWNNERRKERAHTVSESEVTAFDSDEGADSDEDEVCEWDITWSWDMDICGGGDSAAENSEGGEAEDASQHGAQAALFGGAHDARKEVEESAGLWAETFDDNG